MSDISVIEVRIWGRRVGAVMRSPKLGCHVFEYDRAWKRAGIELSPIMMPITDRSSSFSFPSLPYETYKGLPALLVDALPDDFGNALIDSWMVSKGISKDRITMLDRLSYMGSRGMGALEFQPQYSNALDKVHAPLQMGTLVEEARRALRGDLSDDDKKAQSLKRLISVGTSAGGARAKAVIAWNQQTQEIRSGQFDVDAGFEHWLIKFDGIGTDTELGASKDYGRIEYAYFLMAQAAGIDMMPSRLLEENGRAHFMTKRFDRDGNVKHHIQTLCAMDHVDFKKRETNAYENLFMVIDRLGMGDDEKAEAFRRMALNVMAKNCDDHSKNFAFRMKQGAAWELTPAYDVTHAYNPRGKWTYQHLMSVNGKFSGITAADMLIVAERFNIPEAKAILRDVAASVDRWQEFALQAGLNEETALKIQKDFEPGATVVSAPRVK